MASDPEHLPALLCSYVYLKPFQRMRVRGMYAMRDWALDSGAFTAYMKGKVIELEAYTETAKHLLATDPLLTEVFALDVIGNWRAGLKNTEALWAAGVPAIPCYHFGEPVDVLKQLARDYPKIALGGVARKREKAKLAWAAQCFTRVWPKKIHGFGFGSAAGVLGLPFHSTDASSWEMGPACFGQWKAYGNTRLSWRGTRQNMRAEVDWYLDLEQQARRRWPKEMALLDADGPHVRLATIGSGREIAPSVRLSCNGNNPGENNGALKARERKN